MTIEALIILDKAHMRSLRVLPDMRRVSMRDAFIGSADFSDSKVTKEFLAGAHFGQLKADNTQVFDLKGNLLGQGIATEHTERSVIYWTL